MDWLRILIFPVVRLVSIAAGKNITANLTIFRYVSVLLVFFKMAKPALYRSRTRLDEGDRIGQAFQRDVAERVLHFARIFIGGLEVDIED